MLELISFYVTFRFVKELLKPNLRTKLGYLLGVVLFQLSNILIIRISYYIIQILYEKFPVATKDVVDQKLNEILEKLHKKSNMTLFKCNTNLSNYIFNINNT